MFAGMKDEPKEQYIENQQATRHKQIKAILSVAARLENIS